MEQLVSALDTLFVLMGAVMVLAMHAGFAFLEVGTVRHKNQVNALVKIIVDFAVSTIAYFFIGYWVAYQTGFLSSASSLAANNGYDLVKFFFLLTFAAAIPAMSAAGSDASHDNPGSWARCHRRLSPHDHEHSPHKCPSGASDIAGNPPASR